MNKLNKIILNIGLVVLLLIPNMVKADDYPTIIYDGTSQSFSVENIKNNDLFTDLKDMMPGDTRKQTIILKTVNLKKETELFLEATSSVDIDKEGLKIKVLQDSKLISDKGLFKAIKLGKYSDNKTITLELILEVPHESKLSNQSFHLNWNVIAQEIDGDKISYNIVDTSTKNKNSNYILFAGMIIVAMAILYLSKQNNNK